MNDLKREKLQRFANDLVMQEVVYETILSQILKPKKERDVHILAAQALEVQDLNEAWKEIERNKTNQESLPPITTQNGM